MVQDVVESFNDIPDGNIPSDRKALEQSLHLPESFYIGQAAGQGDCFFDAVAQGLSQIRPKEKFTAKLLRMVCKSFAEKSVSNDKDCWLRKSLLYEETFNNEAPLDRYNDCIEFTAQECENLDFLHNGPIWGRPEIEGRIICEEYGIQLHVAERHQGLGVWTNDRVSVTGSMAAPPQYDDENTVHIVNSTGYHFEPILRKNYTTNIKLQHLNDECELENIMVDEKLRKLGELFSGSALQGPQFTQQGFCLNKNSGSVKVNPRDILDKSLHEEDQYGIGEAIVSSNFDLVKKFLQQWPLWPFDIANISFKPEDLWNDIFEKLLEILKINEDSISVEMSGLLKVEIRSRKYLLGIAQTITSVRNIARKSEEYNFYQNGNHDNLICELVRTTCKVLTSWIDHQENCTEKEEKCHHHKLTLLLFSLVAHNVESLQEQSDKLDHSRMIYQEVETSLTGLLKPLIDHERLKHIVECVTLVKTELLQDSCNKTTLENVDKCDSLLRDIRDLAGRVHHEKLELDSVKSLRKHFEELGDNFTIAKLQVEVPDKISETTFSKSSLAIIKERLILDELTRNLQLVHQEDSQWFHRFMLKRVFQLCEESSNSSLKCLITHLSGDFKDVWKKIQDEAQDALGFFNADHMKMVSEESTIGQADLANNTQPDNGQELIDCNADNEQFKDVKCQTTLEKIYAEFVKLLISVTSQSSSIYQNDIDSKFAPALCSKFVTATTRSESKMIATTSGKPNSMKEFQRLGHTKVSKLQDSIEETVDRLIKNILDDILRKTQHGQVSDESIMKLKTRLSTDYQINEKRCSLQSFFTTSLLFSPPSDNQDVICANQDNSFLDFKQTSLDETNAVIEDATKEVTELPSPFEKMAAQRIVGELKGHFTTILLETFSRIKIVINKCSNFLEILQLCRHNLSLRSSLEMLVWESLKILKAASSSTVYILVEKILRATMTFVDDLPYCPFISISLLDYLRPGSFLGVFIGDRLLTVVLIGYLLTTEGEMLIAIQNILEINGGCEFLVNSLIASFDKNIMKKPISKFDRLVKIVKRSQFWKNDLWKRDLIALLKNKQATDSHQEKDQQYVLHLLKSEMFDECNFKNIEMWRTKFDITTIKGPFGYSLLHMACKVGDGRLVEDLLKNGSDANAFDDDKNTPLHIASYHGNIDVMNRLIENSAKPNLENDHHLTALHIASNCGLDQNVEVLLDHGADIEATSTNGFTPLFFALPHVEVVKMLLDHKANVNTRNKENSTTLHEASRLGHLESLKLLLTNGAKLNAMDNSYGTPLHTAVVYGQTDIVKTLLHHGADIYDVCRTKCTLAHHAAFNGHAKILKLVLEKGLKVDKLDEYGMTPLHSAVIGGHLHIIDILKEYFPTSTFLDMVDANQRTALHYAAMQEDNRLVEALVTLGACVNVADMEERTPLHMAAMNKNVKASTFLISKGANINALDHHVCTPITVAAQLGYKEFCATADNQLLTEQPEPLPDPNTSPSLIVSSSNSMSPQGAPNDKSHTIDDPNNTITNMNNPESDKEKIPTSSSTQWTPIHIAVVNNDVDIVSTLLINKGGVNTLGEDDMTPLHLAVEMGYAHCVDILLKKGADVNAICGFHCRTSLHLASRNGHTVIIGKLISANADINCRDKEGNTPICLAAELGETESVQILLDNGGIINSCNDKRRTPLHIAAFHGHCQLLEILLKHNADINSIDAHDCTPLALAVQQSLASATVILLSHGANTSIRDKDGWTPLHICSQEDNVHLMKILLNSQINVDICGKDDFSPLHLADINGSIKSVKLLLDRGADVNKRNRTNQSPLHLACQTGDCAVIKVLLAGGANIEITDVNGSTSLFEAIRSGHLNAVQELVNAGANLEYYCRKDDIRPIFAAIASRRLDMVRVLIEGGAQVNVQNKTHITPLWLATFYRFQEAIELLLKNKANINAADRQNNTPLHIAARGGHLDIVKILLLNSANVDSLNNRNWSPLHEAIDSHHRDVVEILLANGASLDIPLEKSMSAMHLAAAGGDLDIVAFLDAADADVNALDRDSAQTPLHHAVRNGHFDIAQFLISNAANVNVVDACGLTPLRLAIGIHNLSLVNLLLDNGADLNAQDHSQVTPLQVAVKNGSSAELVQVLLDSGAEVNSASLEQCLTSLHLAIAQNNVGIAEVLLRSGADVNSRTKTGATPLHLASGLGHSPIAKMLIESFADVNCLTNEGLTPLHEASGEGHLEIVNILLDSGADVNAIDSKDLCRPLHCAAYEGHDEVIEALLNRGAEIDAALKNGKTALYLSADCGRVRAVKVLLQHGASTLVRTSNGSNMLQAAAISNDVEIIQLILRAMSTNQENSKLNLESTNDRGDTALILAAGSKKKISVDTLLKLGSSPNARNCRGFTALHYAARDGDRDVVDILCSKPKVDSVHSDEAMMEAAMNISCSKPKVDNVHRDEADLDILNKNGDAALHLAIMSNHVEVVETLLERGANPHLLNDGHFSPIHLAAEKGIGKILEVLCLFGADINASNNPDFFTPLHLAAMEGHAKAVRTLVQIGALLDQAINGYDITPLYLAVQNGHAKVAKILLDSGANPVGVKHPNTVLHASICSGNLEIVKLIITEINSKELSMEPFLNAMDYAGDTPLMWAAQAGNTEICKVLLNYGASVHLENNKKMTALHWAATNGHPGVVKILLRYRAKRDIKDIDSNTPLYLAMCGKTLDDGRTDDYDSVIQLLSKK